jgi:hypothetical protein
MVLLTLDTVFLRTLFSPEAKDVFATKAYQLFNINN